MATLKKMQKRMANKVNNKVVEQITTVLLQRSKEIKGDPIARKATLNPNILNRMEHELINFVMDEFKRGIKDDTISRAAVLGPTDDSLDVWVLCLLGYKRPYKATVFIEDEKLMIEYIEH